MRTVKGSALVAVGFIVLSSSVAKAEDEAWRSDFARQQQELHDLRRRQEEETYRIQRQIEEQRERAEQLRAIEEERGRRSIEQQLWETGRGPRYR